MVKVLFVCLGNICRSPMAEAIFRHQYTERRLDDQITTDSAGIAGWHVGQSPDRRALEVLAKHDIETHHLGRKLTVQDFEDFDHISVMDEENFEAVYNMYYENYKQTPGPRKVFLIRDFDPQVRGVHSVPDPYYENQEFFQNVYDILYRSCGALLDYLIEEYNLTVPETEEGE